MDNNYITIGEASRILAVSKDTVRRWEKKGEISSERIDGKNRYFLKSELQGYIDTKPLSVSDAAQGLGVSASTLRRYEKRGLLKPDRGINGKRLYSKYQIANFSILNKTHYHTQKHDNSLREVCLGFALGLFIAMAVANYLLVVRYQNENTNGQVAGVSNSQ